MGDVVLEGRKIRIEVYCGNSHHDKGVRLFLKLTQGTNVDICHRVVEE